METKKIYLGLDIGTDSVGFAVTDDSYHLIRKGGKHLWGSRLFEEASDASGRRMHRSMRRRYQRRRQRILILRDLFKDAINRVDHNFFERLDSSFLHYEDKTDGIQLRYILSDDKEFVNKYKTIYHLRKAMLSSNEKFDIRYIYLVISHMIKYRGNFLKDGEIKSGQAVDASDIKAHFDNIDGFLSEVFSENDDDEFPNFHINGEQANEIISLFQKDMGLKQRIEGEVSIFGASVKKGVLSVILRFASGSKLKFADFFPRLKEDDPEAGKLAIQGNLENFEEIVASSALSDSEKSFLLECKQLYDALLLINLLKGKGALTDAMVSIYDDYHHDLENLKAVIRDFEKFGLVEKGFYSQFFRKPMDKKGNNLINYASFIGNAEGLVKVKNYKPCKEEGLIDAVSAILKKADGTECLPAFTNKRIQEIKSRIDAGKFLLRQNNKSNGVFPYQLNEIELRKIIESQGVYYPFLLDKDKGFPNPNKQEYKLISLLRYRIPYYVGPLSNKVDPDNHQNHWVKKIDDKVKVYPWNFFDVVDRAETAKGFMDHLRNRCSYILGEETLPKCSLIFQLFKVLNELSNLMFDDAPLTEQLKRSLLENVYLKKKTVKAKDIRAELIRLTGITKGKLTTRRGKDDEDKVEGMVKANLSSFIDCESIFGNGFYKNKELFDKAEDVISIITAFEDRQTREEQLRQILDEGQVAKASKLVFKDYAPISKKLIYGLTTPCEVIETGEVVNKNVIDLLFTTGKNFMEIYEGSPDYAFKSQVEALNRESISSRQGNNPLKELIDEAYLSPALKRAVYQTMHIIEELKQILRIDRFDKIFVECTRGKIESKKTPDSRRKKIEGCIKRASSELKKQIDAESITSELSKQTDDALRSKRLYLYFMQMGRDLYTGDPINIDRLSEDYDIDHIIPQAILKDDSYINTVLTLRSKNNKKQDEYPLPNGFITPEGREWIEVLRRISPELMPSDKYSRLLRVKPLTDNELVGFVNRQLVTTSQSVKAVCDILKLTEAERPEDIVYSKAGLVSDFRGFFDLPKVRDLNNLHHAYDAYLNIVVGDVYNQRFSNRMTYEFAMKIKQKGWSLKSGAEDVFKNEISARGNPTKKIWIPCDYVGEERREKPREDSTINLVRRTLSWTDPMTSLMTHRLVGKQGFFNKIATVRSADATEDNYPLKKLASGEDKLSNLKKYGGYSDMTTAYYCLVKSTIKKKSAYSLEGVLSIDDVHFSGDKEVRKEQLKRYFENAGLKNPEIIVDYVPINTVLEMPTTDGKAVKLAITGRSGNSIIAINQAEPKISGKYQRYLKNISKILGSNLPAGKKKDLTKYDINPLADEIVEGTAKVTRKENINLFDVITTDLFSASCYKSLPELGKVLQTIAPNKEGFCSISTIDQCRYLLMLIGLVTCKSSTNNDLSKISDNLSKKAGTIRFSKNLKPGYKLVMPSYTGYFRKTLFTVPD